MVASAETTGETHGGHSYPWHLVEPSIWPILCASTLLAVTAGAVIGLHDGGPWLFLFSVAGFIATLFGWFREVINEATFQGHHTVPVQISMRYGMALFIASEVMFFVAWFWAYFNASLFPPAAIKGQWPPPGIVTFDPWELPFLNTLILMLSGVTVTWAHHALVEGNRRDTLRGLALTIGLGLTFTTIQGLEYAHAGFQMDGGGIYPTTFFMATGFHGAHVIIGTLFLSVCLWRAWRGDFKPDHHFGFEAAAWYWHFVDVVWLFLFTFIYWWGQ